MNQIGFYVVVGLVLGIAFGFYLPEISQHLKLLSDIFIRLITMVVGPIIFCTLVSGICEHGNLKKIGKIALYSIVYFEVLTTIALLIGLVLANIIKPGLNISSEYTGLLQQKITNNHASLTFGNYILNIFPTSFFDAFAKNNLLQILFFSVIFSCAACSLGESVKDVFKIIVQIKQISFKILNYILYLSPFAAFGSIAYAVSKFGLSILENFSELIFVVYFAIFIFIFFVLGLISHLFNFSLLKLLKHLKEEIFLTVGTSSSEAVLPQVMQKLESFGCDPSVTGLVIPSGYSLNLDGTSIYLSASMLFIAQAFNVELTLMQQAYIMLILMINSKGAAAVSGGGFITLSATLFAIDILPTEGLALLIAVDRIISPARSLTNVIGNSVAAVVINKFK